MTPTRHLIPLLISFLTLDTSATSNRFGDGPCSGLIKNEVKLNKHLKFEIEDISFGDYQTLSSFKNEISDYKLDHVEATKIFYFTEKKTSCKIYVRLITDSLNTNARNLAAPCTKLDQCWDGSICKDRFEHGQQEYSTLTNGGDCIENFCFLPAIASPPTAEKKVYLTKNRLLENDGTTNKICKCIDDDYCLDKSDRDRLYCILGTKTKLNPGLDPNSFCITSCPTDYCYDTSFKCVSVSTTYRSEATTTRCIKLTCDITQASIDEDMNRLSVELNLNTDVTKVDVKFSNDNGALDNVPFTRYYMQVFLSDSDGNKIKKSDGTYIFGDKSALGAATKDATLTISANDLETYCELVDPMKAYEGRDCYFMAIVADTCTYLEDNIIYTHLARRIINSNGNGIYIVADDISVASQSEQLRVDFCKYVPEDCYLSVDYAYEAKFCTETGSSCTEVDSDKLYKRNEMVFIKLSFTKNAGTAVTGKTFTVKSVFTKLYDVEGAELDVDEKEVTFSPVSPSGTTDVYFEFELTPSYLFYDDENLLSNKLKLLIIVKITSTRRELTEFRQLEVDLNRVELAPQLGSLLNLNIDEEDLEEYKKTDLNTEKTGSNRIKIIIAVVSSVGGLLLILLAILLYFYLVKKEKDKTNVQEVNQVSTMGDKVEPEQVQVSELQV